jgi:two-component system response regulator MprA
MAHILVVDDDAQIRSLVKRLVGLHGHDVDTAEDGAQALEHLQTKAYDLMIIDNIMPNISGTQAVDIIRTNSKYQDLKILMFSGASMTQTVDAAYAAGVNGFITKPFVADRLISKINGALAETR